MFMGRREHAAIGPTLLVALWLGPSSACVKDASFAAQTDPSNTSEDVETTTGPLLPLTKGTTWTYQVTKQGETSTKVLTVEGEEEIGGDGAYSGEVATKITSTKDGKADGVTWEAAKDKRFVRYREQELSGKGKVKAETSWDPPRLVVDGASAHVASSASWMEQYAETVTEDEATDTSDESDTWSVDAVDAVVTVPAGTFKALVLRRQGGSKAKTFWYVKGVGKVKEEGDELEELVAYKVADDSDGDSDEGSTSSSDDGSDGKGDEGDGDTTSADPGNDPDGDAEPMPGAGDATTKTPDAGTGKTKGTEVAP